MACLGIVSLYPSMDTQGVCSKISSDNENMKILKMDIERKGLNLNIHIFFMFNCKYYITSLHHLIGTMRRRDCVIRFVVILKRYLKF